jgi:4-amino-4-deoxy-L-arabinose transferase-like glycosyltransferase
MQAINFIRKNYILILIILIATILRFYHIDFQSVWLDEIHTINEASPTKSFSEVHEALLISEPHPPLFFFIIHIAFKVFGYTTFVARSVSAIIGILGVFGIYKLGKELFSSKVGIYASILLSLNYFHLYYSQDARMYSLLFLMTVFSFSFLIKFIKSPNYKSLLLYTLFSTLMIYCHFFALFTLISQYIILSYFIFKPYVLQRKQFVLYVLLSGFLTIVLFLPSYSLFIKTTEITSIWIQMPTLDVYTQFFKDFFGQSEIVIFFVCTLLVLFFIKLFSIDNNNFTINPKEDKLLFSFFVLFVWFLVTLFLPLVRTYTSLPMLINRYFINVLPVVIIIVSIGLFLIKNKLIRYFILGTILLFSVTDIVIVKKYYNSPNKTQFREVTQFIIDNNSKNDPVVTSLSWYFPYFLNNENIKTKIVDGSLDNYVNEMIKDSTNRKSFWYVDAHNRPYKVSNETQKYLDEYFSVDANIDLYDTWTKHYIKNSNELLKFDLSQFNTIKNKNGSSINYRIEKFENNQDFLNIVGWAYLENIESQTSNIKLVFISNKDAFILPYQKIVRDDVTNYFKSQKNISNSGFDSKIYLKKLKSGKYQLGVVIDNAKENKSGLVLTDNFFEKK